MWVTLLVCGYTHGGAAAASLITSYSSSLHPARAVSGRPHRPAPRRAACSSSASCHGARHGRAGGGHGSRRAARADLCPRAAHEPGPHLAAPGAVALLPGVVRSPLELTAANVVSAGWRTAACSSRRPSPVCCLGIGGPPWRSPCSRSSRSAAPLRRAAARPCRRSRHPRPEPGLLGTEVGGHHGGLGACRRCALLVGSSAPQYILVGALDLLYVVLAITCSAWAISGRLPELGLRRRRPARRVGHGDAGVARRRLAPALIAGILTAALALGALGLYPTVVGAFVLLAVAGFSRTVFDVPAASCCSAPRRPGSWARSSPCSSRSWTPASHRRHLRAAARRAVRGPGSTHRHLRAFLASSRHFRRLRTIDAHADVPQVEIQLLQSISIFAPLPAPGSRAWHGRFVPLAATSGETVVTEGDVGDRSTRSPTARPSCRAAASRSRVCTAATASARSR